MNTSPICFCLPLQAYGDHDAFNAGSAAVKKVAHQSKLIIATSSFEILAAKASTNQLSLGLDILTVEIADKISCHNLGKRSKEESTP